MMSQRLPGSNLSKRPAQVDLTKCGFSELDRHLRIVKQGACDAICPAVTSRFLRLVRNRVETKSGIELL